MMNYEINVKMFTIVNKFNNREQKEKMNMTEKWIYKIQDIDGEVRELDESEMLEYRQSINDFLNEAIDLDDYDEIARLSSHKEYLQEIDPDLLEDEY